ncbi:MAG TPA: hypothetical protein VIK01_25915 [Polyangiaceae bacterium]
MLNAVHRVYARGVSPNWTLADVVQVLHKGLGPMGVFGALTDEDATDIGIYLATLTPEDNGVIPLCVARSGDMGAAGAGGSTN